MSYVIGIDLGTGSVKGLVVDKTGAVVLEATASYTLIHPQKAIANRIHKIG